MTIFAVAIVLFSLVVIYRWGVVAGLIWLIPFEGVFHGVNVALSDIVLPFAVLGYCARVLPHDVGELLISRRRVGLVATGIYGMLFAAVLSVFVSSSIEHYPLAIPDFLFSAVKLAIGVLYAAVIGYAAVRELHAHRTAVLTAWSWTATFVTAIGIIGLAIPGFGNTFDLIKGGRVNSTFGDANLFASYVIASLAILGLASIRRPSRIRIVQAVVLFFGLLSSGSRAVAPALIIALVVALTASGRIKLLVRAVLIVVCLIPLVLLVEHGTNLSYQQSPLSRTLGGDVDVRDDARWPLWMAAFSMWRDHPITGVGLGQFQERSWDYVATGIDNVPHSTLLGFAAETGTLGVIIFYAVPLILTWRLVVLAHRGKGLGEAYLLFGIIGLGVQSLTINIENSRMQWAFLGIMWAWWRYRAADSTVDPALDARAKKRQRRELSQGRRLRNSACTLAGPRGFADVSRSSMDHHRIAGSDQLRSNL